VGKELAIRSRDDLGRRAATLVNGFDVGCHTASHVDLGVIEPMSSEADIAASLTVRARARQPPTLFAYPYGRKENMSEANLERSSEPA